MRIWLDGHISHRLAPWLEERFEVEVSAARDLGHLLSDDEVIFGAARKAEAVVITKDADFVRLVEARGSPPQVVWLTCGNALDLLRSGEPIVEISDSA